MRRKGWGGGRGRAHAVVYIVALEQSTWTFNADRGRGNGEVWHCPLVSCLSVQVLKVLNSRSTVRELSLETFYHNTLLCSSCHVLLVYSIVVIRPMCLK